MTRADLKVKGFGNKKLAVRSGLGWHFSDTLVFRLRKYNRNFALIRKAYTLNMKILHTSQNQYPSYLYIV